MNVVVEGDLAEKSDCFCAVRGDEDQTLYFFEQLKQELAVDPDSCPAELDFVPWADPAHESAELQEMSLRELVIRLSGREDVDALFIEQRELYKWEDRESADTRRRSDDVGEAAEDRGSHPEEVADAHGSSTTVSGGSGDSGAVGSGGEVAVTQNSGGTSKVRGRRGPRGRKSTAGK